MLKDKKNIEKKNKKQSILVHYQLKGLESTSSILSLRTLTVLEYG
jgi:hypothetical protein